MGLGYSGELEVSIDGGDPVIVSTEWTPGDLVFQGEIGGEPTTVQALRRDGQKLSLVYRGSNFEVAVRDTAAQRLCEHFPEYVEEVNTNIVVTPMPGVVISTNVAPGDPVAAGQALAVVEAMKMQNSLLSPRDGVVKSVNFVAGDKVGDEAVIIELETEEVEEDAE